MKIGNFVLIFVCSVNFESTLYIKESEISEVDMMYSMFPYFVSPETENRTK